MSIITYLHNNTKGTVPMFQMYLYTTFHLPTTALVRLRLKRDGTRAETRFRLSPKRTSPFKSAGTSVQSTAGSRSVHLSVSNAGYTKLRGSVRVLATHSIRKFPLHFPSRASPCAIRFQTHSTTTELETTFFATPPSTYFKSYKNLPR